MDKYIININNVIVTFTKSDKPTKKLKATFKDPKTNRLKNIHFGASGYQHYFDRTHLLDKKLNHLDLKRRDAYRKRHRGDNLTSLSPGFFSWFFLW